MIEVQGEAQLHTLINELMMLNELERERYGYRIQQHNMRDYEGNDDYVADSIEGGGNIFENVYHAFQGPRNDFPPYVRDILAKEKDSYIIDLEVCRKPIRGIIKQFANLISLGTLHRNIYYDDLFHLYLIIFLDNGKSYKLEKNHVINLDPYNGGPCGIHVSLGGKNLTLGQFLENALGQIGDKFFHYDIVGNNCQNFVNDLLSCNGLNNSALADYILQDPRKILEDTPEISKQIVDIITGVASRADILLYGKSIMKKRKAMGKGKGKMKGKALVKPKKHYKNTDVQSIVFRRNKWTKAQAEKWIRDHGYEPIKEVDEHISTEYRYRMKNPDQFNTFRAHNLPGNVGIELIFGFKD